MGVLKKNIFGLIAIIIVIAAVVVLGRENARLTREINLLDLKIDQKNSETFQTLDAKIERSEERIASLKESGYVEDAGFIDAAAQIFSSTVLVASAADIDKFSPNATSPITTSVAEHDGVGTGFFISSDGGIVTARHVIDSIGSDDIAIKTVSGVSYKAVLVATDDVADIAVLKIDAASPAFVELGYFENIALGDEIGFVGFSLSTGISHPLLHRGVVSTKGRTGDGADIFTVNGFINKGNSGGAVFSARTGRVVGVMSARQRDTLSHKYIQLPSDYTATAMLGNVDPLRLAVDLYNENVNILSDVSQVGIGVVYSTDGLRALFR